MLGAISATLIDGPTQRSEERFRSRSRRSVFQEARDAWPGKGDATGYQTTQLLGREIWDKLFIHVIDATWVSDGIPAAIYGGALCIVHCAGMYHLMIESLRRANRVSGQRAA